MREGNYDFAKTYEWMEQKYLIILQAQDRSSIIWGGGKMKLQNCMQITKRAMENVQLKFGSIKQSIEQFKLEAASKIIKPNAGALNLSSCDLEDECYVLHK